MTDREAYAANGFLIHPAPVLPGNLVRRAVKGVDAIRRGEYDRGQPPERARWNPGDDPNAPCKIEQPQKANYVLPPRKRRAKIILGTKHPRTHHVQFHACFVQFSEEAQPLGDWKTQETLRPLHGDREDRIR